MPPLAGFSDNSFQTHADFKDACVSLLRALKPYQSSGGARIRLPLVTGTHFDDVAAQLEGFARPLWTIGALVHGSCLTTVEYEELVEPYVRGLANGTDPGHAEYWGPVILRDQRMVEMEIISFALLMAPDVMFHKQTEQAQANIRDWLNTLNEKDFPVTNWLWFRVMTNLALVKVCGVPFDTVRAYLKDDLDQMENFYLDEGWSADGIWGDGGRQADYYSGSFAIQFSQLLYMKMAEQIDPDRCRKFRDRAVAFASSFWRYFDETGAAIPFGRSLTYRFALAGFWSAVAFAEVELPAPLDDWGIVKGLLLRHFRWWSRKSDLFNVDGTLTIGFAYPNMYMSEDYNSPQSPYWAMKSFVALGLSPEHPFWSAVEKPLPVEDIKISMPIRPPMQIVCHTKNHHFLLSSGQFCPWPLKATEAKYGKFTYSSHFGFSVPTGTLIQQLAPDSTLALSKDDEESFRVPWKVQDFRFGAAWLRRGGQILEEIPTLRNTWRPWKDANVEVATLLIAPCQRWRDWHIRVHQFKNLGNSEITISMVQGGFAIQGREDRLGGTLPSYKGASSKDHDNIFLERGESAFPEGTQETGISALICSNAGSSGIRMMSSSSSFFQQSKGEVLKPDSNTNLIWQRTLIPTLKSTATLREGTTGQVVSAVYAVGRNLGFEDEYKGISVEEGWKDAPLIAHSDLVEFPTAEFILLAREW
ncbi:hypothetical protein BU23DRAFT_660042 [Bimuria novae-zelandiae CBS 107.79]|uniref:Uncharacterized protein n=1 Tax=Bimuria novae-zelandiae CBS 107.79 TaxID=1447943 RepID=A0A6A5VLI5_9PLEO|nr:hypothetical protein BU23DRAFT_660042 [Bimuria novae-zelandiae CBS 107.79]